MKLSESQTFEFFVKGKKIWVEYNGKAPVLLADLLRSGFRSEITSALHALWRYIRVRDWETARKYPRDWRKAILLYIQDNLGKYEYPLDVIMRTPTDITINRESRSHFEAFFKEVPSAESATATIHGVGVSLSQLHFKRPTIAYKKGVVVVDGGFRLEMLVIDLEIREDGFEVIGPSGSVVDVKW